MGFRPSPSHLLMVVGFLSGTEEEVIEMWSGKWAYTHFYLFIHISCFCHSCFSDLWGAGSKFCKMSISKQATLCSCLLANLRQLAWWKEEEEEVVVVLRVRPPGAETKAHAGVDFEVLAEIPGKTQGIPGEKNLRSLLAGPAEFV